jgi:hypothetical protein
LQFLIKHISKIKTFTNRKYVSTILLSLLLVSASYSQTCDNTIYYSAGNGNFTTANIWSTTSGGAGNYTYNPADPVRHIFIIENGHNIVINTPITISGLRVGGNGSNARLNVLANINLTCTTDSIQINNNGLVILNGNYLVAPGANNRFAMSGGELQVTADIPVFLQAFENVSLRGGVVNYNRTGDQTINDQVYCNLALTGSGVKRLNSTIDIIGNLGIAPGVELRIDTDNANINLSGDWINNGTYNSNGRISYVEFNRTIGNQSITGYTEFQSLQINKAASRYLILNDNIRILNNLSFTGDGVLQLGTNDLILSPSVTSISSSTGLFHANRMIQQNGSDLSGRVNKELTSAANFVFQFPVGTGTFYTPVNIGPMNASVTGTGSISLNTVPYTSALNNIVTRYVTIATSGISNITQAPIRLYYDNSEETGTPNLVVRIVGGVTQNVTDAGADLNTNFFGAGAENTALDGEWRFINSGTLPVTYYSYQSGNWNTPATWTTDPTGTTQVGMPAAGPASIDHVVILNGRTVNVTNNNNTLASLTIQEGGVLDVAATTNHNFGNIYGSGTLRLSSANIPAGNITSFVSAGGGTIEFYNFSGQLPIQNTYNNLLISNSTANNYNLVLTNPANPTNYRLNGTFEMRRTGSGTMTLTMANAARTINMDVYGSFTVGTGCNFVLGAFNATHNINLYNNFADNGTVNLNRNADYSQNTQGAAILTFWGLSNNTAIVNNTTRFWNFRVNKGSDQTYILDVTGTVAGCDPFKGRDPMINSDQANERATISIYAGTVRLGANLNVLRLSSDQGYDIGVDVNQEKAQLWIDGATVAESGFIAIYGKLKISAGTLNTDRIVIRYNGSIEINGGTLNVAQIRPSIYTNSTPRGSFLQSGGTLNVTGPANNTDYPIFCWPHASTAFIMTGGVFNVTGCTNGGNAATGGVMILSDNYQVTGGVFNIYSSTAAGANFNINSKVPFWNLNIYAQPAGNHTITTNTQPNLIPTSGTTYLPNPLPAQPLVVLNNLQIFSTNNPILNTFNQNVTVGGNFLLEIGTTYTPGTNTTNFNGNAAQTFTNNGTITTGLYNLVITNRSNTSIAQNLIVRNDLSINSGCTLQDMGRTINVAANIIHSGTHISQANGCIILSGAAAQSIGGDGNGIFGNLAINKTSGLASLSANQSLTGNLRLANGLLNIGAFHLSLGASSNVYDALTGTNTTFSGTKMIRTAGNMSDGGVTKILSASVPSFVYPTGTGTVYTPVTANIAATGYGTLNVRPVNKRHPALSIPPANVNDALGYFWKISSQGFSGVTSGSLQFTYQSSLIPGGEGTDNAFLSGRFNLSTNVWNTQTGVDAANNQFIYNFASTIDGEYTAGNNNAFNPAIILESIASGNWENPSTWRKLQSGVVIENPSLTIPNASTPVIIRNGHTVTVATTTPAVSATLTIQSNAILDLGSTISTANHNFGTLISLGAAGNGTMRISSNAGTARFPAGDFADFLDQNGGTVEYYRTTTNFTIPVTSIAPSSISLQSYRNLNIVPNGGTITLPNLDLRIYGNFTTNATGANSNVLLSNNANGNLQVDGNLSISGNSSLLYQNNTLRNVRINGNITIDNNATLGVNNNGTVVNNALVVGGNVINNGTMRLLNGTRYVNTTFTGSGNRSITGIGANTIFNRLIVDKGIDTTYSLEVNANSFSLQATSAGALKALELKNGTFKLSSNQTITLNTGNNNGADFQIPSSTQLWINNGRALIDATGTNAGLVLGGKLRVSGNGEINISSSGTNDNYIEYSGVGRPTIEVNSGQLIVGSQIRRPVTIANGSLSYIQTGGNVSVGTQSAPVSARGVFEVLNTGSEFRMTGGTLTIVRPQTTPSIASLYLSPAYSDIQNSTIQIGTTNSSAANIQINSSLPLWNLIIGTNTGTNINSSLSMNNLQVARNLTIQNGATLNTNNLNVSIGGDFTMNGTYNYGTNTTIFNGNSVSQNITGNLAFHNATIANTSATGLVSLNNNIQINNLLTLANGVLFDNGYIITATGNIDNSAEHSSSGNGRILLTSTVPQSLSGSGLGVFGSMEINNNAGVDLTTNQTINNRLTFTNGLLNIASYRLTLGSNFNFAGTVSETAMIRTSGSQSDNGVQLNITSGAFDYTVPFGITGKYTPVRYTSASNANNGWINVKPVNAQHPLTSDGLNKELSYYWQVTSNGLAGTTVTHEYNYADMDVIGRGIETEFVGARYYSGSWTTDGTVNTSQNRIYFTNVTYFDGDYTVGEFSEFGVTGGSYETAQSGAWENGSTWVGGVVPVPNAQVIINPTHIVTTTTNSKRTYSLYLRNNSEVIINATTGHYFGNIHGTGTLTIGTNIIPGGDYTGFVAADSGTIQYTHSGSISSTLAQYNNLIINSTGIITLPPISPISIRGNLTIASGTLSATGQRLHLYRNYIVNGTFNYGNSTVEFRGNNLQTVSGSGNISFSNVRMNNAAGVTFTESATINTELTFVNGLINTTAGREIIFAANASHSGASNISYINGVVRKISNGTPFIFPIGSNIQYRQLELGIFIGEYSAQYINTAYNSSQIIAPLTRASDSEHWIINRIAGSSNPDLVLSWSNLNQIPVVNNLVSLRIANWNGTSWVESSSSPVYSGTLSSGTITVANFAQTGRITLATTEVPIVRCPGDANILYQAATSYGADNYTWTSDNASLATVTPDLGDNRMAYATFSGINEGLGNIVLTVYRSGQVMSSKYFSYQLYPAQPVITPSGSTTFCEGGSVQLQAPVGYSNYQWTNAETTPNILVDAAGSYSVRVQHSNSCWSTYSDATIITELTGLSVGAVNSINSLTER